MVSCWNTSINIVVFTLASGCSLHLTWSYVSGVHIPLISIKVTQRVVRYIAFKYVPDDRGVGFFFDNLEACFIRNKTNCTKKVIVRGNERRRERE